MSRMESITSRRCEMDKRLVAEELELGDHEWTHVLSNLDLGVEEWLKPYCKSTLESAAIYGVKNQTSLALLFQIDCIETLERSDIRTG